MPSEKKNPYGPGRPRVAKNSNELPDEPGEYRLVDTNPGILKTAIRTLQGKDPKEDHRGIASNLSNRVGPSHEKYDPDKHEIHFQVAQGEKSPQLWEAMKEHEKDSLAKAKPGLSSLSHGGAGRPPKWATQDDHEDYDDCDDDDEDDDDDEYDDDDESSCPWCGDEGCLILEDDEYEGQRIYTCCTVYFDEDGDLWPQENPMGDGYCRCCGNNRHAEYCGKELCGGCCEGYCGEDRHG